MSSSSSWITGKKRKASMAAGTAKRARRESRRAPPINRATVQRMILSNLETKHKYKYIPVESASTPDFHLLNGIDTTGLPYSREGNKVHMMGLDFRLVCVPQSAQMERAQLLRYMIVLDRQPNGAAPTIPQILDQTVCLDPALAPRADEFMPRFRVLASDQFWVGHSTQFAPNMYSRHVYIDLNSVLGKDAIVQYTTTTDTIGAISKNSLYFIILPSNQAQLSGAGPYPYIDYSATASLTFKDA